MNESNEGENRESHTEPRRAKHNSVYLWLAGCLAGCALGFALSIAVFTVLLMHYEKYSKPTDSDFANPIGVMLFMFASTAVCGLLGMILFPFIVSLFRSIKVQKQK